MNSMKRWRPLLLLFPLFQATAADNDPFSSAAKLDLALPTRLQDFKLSVRVTGSLPQPVHGRAVVRALRSRNPIVIDVVGQKNKQDRVVNGALAEGVAPNAEIVGIGLALRLSSNTGLPEVAAVIPNSPAAAAGLSSGDTIYMVDGANTEGLDLESTVNLVRGFEGTPIRLQIGRKGQERPMQLELIRKKVLPLE